MEPDELKVLIEIMLAPNAVIESMSPIERAEMLLLGPTFSQHFRLAPNEREE